MTFAWGNSFMACGGTVIEILSESRRTLKEKGWTRSAMARDGTGLMCGLNSDQAACYCLWASVVKAWRLVDPENEKFYFPFFERKFLEILELKFSYPFPVTRWNDEVARSLEDVTALLDAVIATIPPDARIVVPARVPAPAIGRPGAKARGDQSSINPDLEPALLISGGVGVF
jgi:hypothetical protein